MLTSLRRGALAGLLAGLLTAAYGFLLAEPLMDRAVDLEAARAAAAGGTSTEVFSRTTQHFGFLGAAIVVGIALGVLYGVVARLLPAAQDPWRRALQLGGAGFFAVSFVPFVRYPGNPPGVGDSGTIDTRTSLFEVAIVIGLVGVCFAALIVRSLRERGRRASTVQLAVTGVLLATIALTFVLPGNTDPIDVPVTLVWEFRLLSISALALLWGSLAVAYGLLAQRATTPTPTPS